MAPLARYTYHIYEDDPETVAVTLEGSVALPHIEIGHQLLATEPLSRSGKALMVEGVRVSIVHSRGRLQGYEIHVFCRGVGRDADMSSA